MKLSRLFQFGAVLLLSSAILFVDAQNPRLEKHVEKILQKEYCQAAQDEIIVFTGSSSIRIWKDIQNYFPGKVVLNNGFGGSNMSDLLDYYKKTIVAFHPDKVFIYEGDNDIAAKKTPSKILSEAKKLVRLIKKELPDIEIVFISPKPSLRRWTFKDEYIELNKKLRKYCETKPNIEFANVWDIMLNEEGMPIKDVFGKDGIHMKKAGYELWYKVLKDYID